MRGLVTCLLLGATPVVAQDGLPLPLYLQNDSERGITSVTIYPVRPNGEIVDDVTAWRDDDISRRSTAIVDTRLTECRKIAVRVTFDDGEEVMAQTDLCQNSLLIAQD